MNRLLNIGAGVLAFLATAALVAAAAMAIMDNRGERTAEDAVADAAAIWDAGKPAPAATASVYTDAYIKEVPNLARELPELTENQIAEAKSLLDSDPSLNSLLAGESYAIQSMGPWVSGKEWEFIGALVYIGLDNPVAFDGFLPIAESYDKPEDGSGELYVDGGHVQRLQAEGIESLSILVDLNKDKVVTIEVEKAANLNIDYEYGSQPPESQK